MNQFIMTAKTNSKCFQIFVFHLNNSAKLTFFTLFTFLWVLGSTHSISILSKSNATEYYWCHNFMLLKAILKTTFSPPTHPSIYPPTHLPNIIFVLCTNQPALVFDPKCLKFSASYFHRKCLTFATFEIF